jgi:carbamoyl-phosphate synthase large subunit
MTDPDFADATYIEPITPAVIETIIAKERPDAILPTLGGQTALNAAMALHARGVLEKYDVELIGAKVEAIQKGEDRQIFKQLVLDAGADVAASRIAHSMDECLAAAEELGYPVVVRPSFTMGGLGSGFAYDETDLRRIAGAGLHDSRTRSCSRSPSSAGRSTSSSSCATPPTTRSWSARSRTSTPSACTRATRSRSHRR